MGVFCKELDAQTGEDLVEFFQRGVYRKLQGVVGKVSRVILVRIRKEASPNRGARHFGEGFLNFRRSQTREWWTLPWSRQQAAQA